MEYPYFATDENPDYFLTQNHLTMPIYGRQTRKIVFPSILNLPGN